MTKIRIGQLIWDEFNSEHIKKHNVTKEEANEVIRKVNAHREGYSGRIILIGRAGKRILAILLAPKGEGKYYPVTVRDADKKERRLLYDNEKK
jgi:uncharacterized DUF497 family protein